MKLDELRDLTKKIRGFWKHSYIWCKTSLIYDFFSKQNLDSCVLGLSGGVDSAVTLGLLLRAREKYGLPKVVLPLLMPIRGLGTSGQDEATRLAKLQCEKFNLDYKLVDLSNVYQTNLKAAGRTDNAETAWANGQLASILRTPCSYFHAAILQEQGYRSIVVGTTNRDEGSYIGFYGKASDAMVDLQPIADIHKSEVYEIAPLLGVIPEIATRDARGDVWNNVSTVEMVGAPYWFLEMYTIILQHKLQGLVAKLDPEDCKSYEEYRSAIEDWHRKNQHKYNVGLPSHFIDCMDRRVPGGW